MLMVAHFFAQAARTPFEPVCNGWRDGGAQVQEGVVAVLGARSTAYI